MDVAETVLETAAVETAADAAVEIAEIQADRDVAIAEIHADAIAENVAQPENEDLETWLTSQLESLAARLEAKIVSIEEALSRMFQQHDTMLGKLEAISILLTPMPSPEMSAVREPETMPEPEKPAEPDHIQTETEIVVEKQKKRWM
jgi:hypothetical protein